MVIKGQAPNGLFLNPLGTGIQVLEVVTGSLFIEVFNLNVLYPMCKQC